MRWDYGFAINDILGMVFLVGAKATVNLGDLTIDFS